MGLRNGKLVVLAATLVAILAIPSSPTAHDIPGDVSLHAFVKPEGNQLRMLIRLPLEAMLDVNFPVSYTHLTLPTILRV